jgi:nucleotide sugar dehydrogenase
MPAILRVKPEEIDTTEKRGRYTVSVIGCGQNGILCAMAFAESGFRVKCVDADQSVVKRVAKGKTLFSDREVESKLKSLLGTGQITVTNDLKGAVSQSDIITMTITPKIDAKNNPDYSELEISCKHVGAALHRDTLFVYCGTSGLGFTESVIKETLENASGLKNGQEFGVVYNPIQPPDEQTPHFLTDQELKVAGFDKTSLEAASIVLGTLTKKGVRKVPNVKSMELATLFAATMKDVENSLANELAILCERAGSDYFEVSKLFDSHKPMAASVMTDAKGLNETYILLENAENLNTKLRLSKLARQINQEAIWHAINLTQTALRSCGKTFRRARIAVLGSAKPGATSVVFVRMLETKGAKASLYDPFWAKIEYTDAMPTLKKSLREAVEGADCLVLVLDQNKFKPLNLKKLRAVMKTPASIVDLTGLVNPQEIEREGFVYRGYGRSSG